MLGKPSGPAASRDLMEKIEDWISSGVGIAMRRIFSSFVMVRLMGPWGMGKVSEGLERISVKNMRSAFARSFLFIYQVPSLTFSLVILFLWRLQIVMAWKHLVFWSPCVMYLSQDFYFQKVCSE